MPQVGPEPRRERRRLARSRRLLWQGRGDACSTLLLVRRSTWRGMEAFRTRVTRKRPAMNLAHAETRRTTNQTANSALAAIISKAETTQIIQTMRRPDGFMGCQTRRI